MKRLLLTAVSLFIILATLEAGGQTPKKEDVPKYLQMLKSAKAADRALGAEMLGRRGAVNAKDVEDAIDPLKKALKNDTDVAVRRQAALAIGMIAPEPASQNVPLLVESLTSDKEFPVRLAVAQALAVYGPEAKEALPALRDLQKEAKEKDKKDAMRTINMAIQSIQGKKK